MGLFKNLLKEPLHPLYILSGQRTASLLLLTLVIPFRYLLFSTHVNTTPTQTLPVSHLVTSLSRVLSSESKSRALDSLPDCLHQLSLQVSAEIKEKRIIFWKYFLWPPAHF